MSRASNSQPSRSAKRLERRFDFRCARYSTPVSLIDRFKFLRCRVIIAAHPFIFDRSQRGDRPPAVPVQAMSARAQGLLLRQLFSYWILYHIVNVPHGRQPTPIPWPNPAPQPPTTLQIHRPIISTRSLRRVCKSIARPRAKGRAPLLHIRRLPWYAATRMHPRAPEAAKRYPIKNPERCPHCNGNASKKRAHAKRNWRTFPSIVVAHAVAPSLQARGRCATRPIPSRKSLRHSPATTAATPLKRPQTKSPPAGFSSLVLRTCIREARSCFGYDEAPCGVSEPYGPATIRSKEIVKVRNHGIPARPKNHERPAHGWTTADSAVKVAMRRGWRG